MRLGEISELANKCHTIAIPADATNIADLEKSCD